MPIARTCLQLGRGLAPFREVASFLLMPIGSVNRYQKRPTVRSPAVAEELPRTAENGQIPAGSLASSKMIGHALSQFSRQAIFEVIGEMVFDGRAVHRSVEEKIGFNRSFSINRARLIHDLTVPSGSLSVAETWL